VNLLFNFFSIAPFASSSGSPLKKLINVPPLNELEVLAATNVAISISELM